ncbi:hypothetical protein BV20DRAFT_632511 [Pilatotrama ljubarskyi]|nr:hypothetical protein BV20DRAFT_632511 [Pilatotrama ljubarskyi]
MATQPAQSLPSFAQAFGAPSLSRIPDANNALPPIHAHAHTRASPFDTPRPSPSAHEDSSTGTNHLPPMADAPPARHPSRKRAHPDSTAHPDDHLSSGSDDRRSPKSVRIKEEADYDALPSPSTRTAPPAPGDRQPHQDASAPSPAPSAAAAPAPAPSTARPSPSKKRRVTISGISHPINTDVRPPPASSADPANNAISPVVMGLPIPRDDAAAIEQVRSMLSIKQQQKELIEQRRGSNAGVVSSVGSPAVSVSVVNAPSAAHQSASDERQPKSHAPARASGRSPVANASSRRSTVSLTANAPPNRAVSPLARHPSPPPPSHHQPHTPMLHPPPPPVPGQEQHSSAPHSHALPAPPISFARRRATRQFGGAKGKPADIMISPRDAAADRLQPSIQSAPPIPRAGTNTSMTGRFSSMALPSLPPVLGPGQSTQRMTASRVPPTPTRLSMARHAPAAGASSILTPTVGSISGAVAGRSPPTASVPIATTLVPQTPAALHAPGYAGEKAAFLAPFEMFYDALADSKTLKGWLGEQLQKSQALAERLQRQQEHLDELVAAAVERRMAPVREEVYGLQRRVEELEMALHHAVGGAGGATGLVRTASGGQGYSPSMGAKGKAKANGIPAHTVVPESYQFPPSDGPGAGGLRRPEPVRRALSPAQLERETESRSFPGSQAGSPVPFDVGRRLSVSAIRLDPRSPAVSEPPHAHAHAHPHPHAHPHSHQHSHRPSVGTPQGPGVTCTAGRERELGGRALPPPPSAAPGGGGGGGSWNRPWSPRSSRASLPAGTSATRSSLGHPSDRPGIARRSSAQRVTGEGYAYASPEGADGREREREREREASSPPAVSGHGSRREVRSPEPMGGQTAAGRPPACRDALPSVLSLGLTTRPLGFGWARRRLGGPRGLSMSRVCAVATTGGTAYRWCGRSFTPLRHLPLPPTVIILSSISRHFCRTRKTPALAIRTSSSVLRRTAWVFLSQSTAHPPPFPHLPLLCSLVLLLLLRNRTSDVQSFARSFVFRSSYCLALCTATPIVPVRRNQTKGLFAAFAFTRTYLKGISSLKF